MSNLSGRDFLSLKDFTEHDIMSLVTLGLRLKKEQKEGTPHPLLKGKSLAMIFQKASTRTRLAFEVGMYQLGGQAIFLNANDMQLGRGEPIKDTARVLSRMTDGILIRTYAHRDVEELAEYADVPVINGLTDLFHPTQIIADFMTIMEHKGALKGQTLAYVGDGNNVTHSLLIGSALVGMNMRVATPKGYEPDAEIIALAETFAKESGAQLNIGHDFAAAVDHADVVYTDTWASMGQEDEKAAREKAFQGYQVDGAAMAHAASDAIFLHCLPAYRGYEVTDDVIEGPGSVVFDEAENRLHAHKAIMAAVMS